MIMKKKIAFICVHNSCRSQLAEAFGKAYISEKYDCYSAGTETKPQINQDAVRLMRKLYGIDMEKELAILRAKLPHMEDRLRVAVAEAVQKLREMEQLIKKPSIAETLDWAAALDALGVAELTPDVLRQTAGFILKNSDDLEQIHKTEEEDHCHCGGGCGGHHHG